MCAEEKTNEEIAAEIGRTFALSIFRYLWLPESSRAAFVQAARDYIAGYPPLERLAVNDTICALQQANGETVCVLSIPAPSISLPPARRVSECARIGEGGYACTEPYGHDGDHVAKGANGVVYLRWSTEDPNPFAPGTFPEDEVFAIEHDR